MDILLLTTTVISQLDENAEVCLFIHNDIKILQGNNGS
jgi:hypothetical protein